MKNTIFILIILTIGCNSKKNKENDWEIDYGFDCSTNDTINLRSFFDFVPSDIELYFDLNRALIAGKTQNKPIIIIFTCIACKSFDYDWIPIESNDCIDIVKSNYILTYLILDSRSRLKNIDSNLVDKNGKIIENVGDCYHEFQRKLYNDNVIFRFVIVDSEMNQLVGRSTNSLLTKDLKKILEMGLYKYKSTAANMWCTTNWLLAD